MKKKKHRRLSDKIYKNFPRFKFSRIRFIDFDDTFSPPYPTKKQKNKETSVTSIANHCQYLLCIVSHPCELCRLLVETIFRPKMLHLSLLNNLIHVQIISHIKLIQSFKKFSRIFLNTSAKLPG